MKNHTIKLSNGDGLAKIKVFFGYENSKWYKGLTVTFEFYEVDGEEYIRPITKNFNGSQEDFENVLFDIKHKVGA